MTWKGFKDIQATILVDLTPPIETIWKNMDRSRRKNIRHAMESGLQFVQATTKEEFNKFYSIYVAVWHSGGIEAQSREYFNKPNYKLYLAKYNEEIVGGGLFEELEDRIVFKAYASMIEHQELRINDFIYWSSFLLAKEEGKTYCDLGGWQILARNKLEGVNAFKEKFGGKVTTYKIYSKNPFYIISRKLYRNFYPFRWLADRVRGRKVVKPNKESLNKKVYDTSESVQHFDKLNDEGLFKIESEIAGKYFRGKILDLGCGCGRTTLDLIKQNYDVIGVDISKNMIDYAKKKYPYPDTFQVGNACKLDFPENTFDTVFFSYNGIDYIYPESKRIQALKEIDRVLKPYGKFVFSSHNPKALWFKPRPRFIMRNILRFTLCSKYKYEKQPIGSLYTYYASPKKQKRLIEKNTSMEFKEKRVNKKDKLHPYYIFTK
jgi:ubiquinone/menaquinone biosynthesis C-methylase UbiE